MFSLRKCRIGIVGLGYVGLPLAVEFGQHFATIGFDIRPSRIEALRKGRDSTLEVNKSQLAAATQLAFTTNLQDLRRCQVYVVTVPTPIDEYKRPDLRPLIEASRSVSQVLKKGDVVIYESTVYPGVPRRSAYPFWNRGRGSGSTATFLPATVRSASTRATRSTGCRTSGSHLWFDGRSG